MAKRKSLNRRLSKYTRQSVGSAILDPDTDNLGDEHPYWWENLENDTAIRSSSKLSSLNQTSRHLDSSSRIEASQAKDGWWKALEHSNTSNSLQTKRIRAEKVAADDESTIESEEELRIAKRKFPLRSKLRKTEGNAFLNVLNDTTIKTRFEPVQATTKRESSLSSDKVDVNVEQSNETREDTLDRNQSGNVTGILKSKPKIFGRNRKRQTKNVFVEVLNEHELQNLSKGISFISSNESRIAIKDTIPAGIETMQTHNRMVVYPAPQAQSTELEDNGLSASNSSSSSSVERMVLKPKSKFLMQRYKTREENAFKDVLEEQEVTNKIDKSGSVNKKSPAVSEIHEYSLRSLKNSKTFRDDAADERVISAVRSADESGKDNLLAKEASTFVRWNDTPSNANENYTRSKRSSLARSSKNQQKNKSDDLLGESSGVDVSSSKSKRSLNREERKSTRRTENKLKLNRDSRDLSGLELNTSERRRSKNLSASRAVFEEIRSGNVEEETQIRSIERDWSSGAEDEQSAALVANEANMEKLEACVNNNLNGSVEKQFLLNPSVSRDKEDRKSTSNRVIPSDGNGKGKRGQTSIRNFFKSSRMLPVSQAFADKGKIEEIKNELTRVRERELARMKAKDGKKPVEAKASSSREKKPNQVGTETKAKRNSKRVDKAYLVNGQPWRAPRLPRPHRWITDRLYKYLWNCLEPKFKLETRIVSEKFVHQLSSVTTLIMKRASYSDYQLELNALMKEMARLGIVRSRNDFYNFCHDFFPYELRVKTVPMLLPGNKKNIPYNEDTLHAPLLNA